MNTQYKIPAKQRIAAGSEEGFSLIEILVAAAIIVILITVIASAVSFGKTKGQALYEDAKTFATAAKRFELATSCYPSNTEVLFNLSAGGDTANSCGESVAQDNVHPYINAYSDVDANHNIVLNSIGPGVTATIGESATNTNLNSSEANMAYVEFKNVPIKVAVQAAKICGVPAGQLYGNNCIIGADTGAGTTTFQYVFAFYNS